MAQNRDRFLRKWILINFAGWAVSIVWVFYKGLYQYEYPTRTLYGIELWISLIRTLVIAWGPAGFIIGISQWFALKNFGVKFYAFVSLTTISCAIFPSIASITMQIKFTGQAAWTQMIIWGIDILFIGASIGWFQLIEIRKYLNKPTLWVIANSFGLFVFISIFFFLIMAAFGLSPIIRPYLYEFGLDQIVWYRDLLLTIFMGIASPILAVITITLPTGKILEIDGKWDKLLSSASAPGNS